MRIGMQRCLQKLPSFRPSEDDYCTHKMLIFRDKNWLTILFYFSMRHRIALYNGKINA